MLGPRYGNGNGIFHFRKTLRGFAPSPGPTPPRCSRISTMRAAGEQGGAIAESAASQGLKSTARMKSSRLDPRLPQACAAVPLRRRHNGVAFPAREAALQPVRHDPSRIVCPPPSPVLRVSSPNSLSNAESPENGIFHFRKTSRGFAPSPGPTTPRCSRISTMRAARV